MVVSCGCGDDLDDDAILALCYCYDCDIGESLQRGYHRDDDTDEEDDVILAHGGDADEFGDDGIHALSPPARLRPEEKHRD